MYGVGAWLWLPAIKSLRCTLRAFVERYGCWPGLPDISRLEYEPSKLRLLPVACVNIPVTRDRLLGVVPGIVVSLGLCSLCIGQHAQVWAVGEHDGCTWLAYSVGSINATH
jgi:hypothetical protein